jgi:hypothetical protein
MNRRFYRAGSLRLAAPALGIWLTGVCAVSAQIGGHTAFDGPFTLDNVEDLDLVAGGVGRDWIPDYVEGIPNPLQAQALSSSGLTLASGQTPAGALRFRVLESYGWISKGFGVPTPSVVAASTLTDPGDISSFESLTFLACFQPVLANQKFEVILETYPGPPYPTIHWDFTPAPGTTFQEVTINLRSPSLVENAGSLSIDQLLTETRFLYFYCFAGPVTPATTLDFHIDDIRLTRVFTAVPNSLVYR